LWNAAAAGTFGYSASEAIEMSVENLVPDYLKARHRAGMSGYRETGHGRYIDSNTVLELPAMHRDGQEIKVEMTLSPIDPVQGAVERPFVLAIIRDVTGRKKAEEEIRKLNEELEERVAERTAQLETAISRLRSSEQTLRESEERYRAVIEQAAEGIVLVDAGDKSVLETNLEFQRLFGYTSEEAAGLTIYDLVAHDRESVDRNVELILEEGNRIVGERRYRCKDGSLVDVIVSGSATSYGGRRVISLIIRDITERKLVEETLKESEERFRLLVEGVQDYAIFMLDVEGRVATWNVGAERAKGYKADEIIGEHFSRFYTSEDIERRHPEEELRVAAAAEGRYEDEGWRVRKDGSCFWANVVITAVRDAAGELRGFSKVTRDITERKRAEEELEARARKLEKSNAELEQFAYVASHDLQEPLRMVSSYTQLLARRYRGQLDETADEFIGYAVDGASRMQVLIKDLLTYSRVGTRDKELVPTNLTVVFDAAESNLRTAIEESGATVTSDQLPTVMGNDVQLTQLFQNLIANAIKFRDEEPPEVHVGAERRDGNWLFSVRDNGIGLDPQYADRIFVIFQRLHDRTAYSGTGIGLAVCKKIVEQHGGRIWVESKPEGGSTFYFTLPFTGENRASGEI
jgi:PAS domain S-box-containing protein